jgi:hypothetical protein
VSPWGLPLQGDGDIKALAAVLSASEVITVLRLTHCTLEAGAAKQLGAGLAGKDAGRR